MIKDQAYSEPSENDIQSYARFRRISIQEASEQLNAIREHRIAQYEASKDHS